MDVDVSLLDVHAPPQLTSKIWLKFKIHWSLNHFGAKG